MGILLQKLAVHTFLIDKHIFFVIVVKHDKEQVHILQNKRHQDTHIYIKII
jgi:hypothetical protein